MILGLTGPMGSGKTTVVNALQKIGFRLVTLSDMVREEARDRGIPEKRELLMEVGQGLRETHGAGVLAMRALKKIQSEGGDLWIVDGIRNPAEVEILRAREDFFLIANTAPEDMIVKRILSRKREDDTLDDAQIRRKLRREMGEGEPEDGQQLEKCIKLADAEFRNTMPYHLVESEFMKFYNETVCKTIPIQDPAKTSTT